MFFRTTFLTAVLAATSVLGAAIDTSKISSTLARRQQFQQKTYDQISISGGVAGNAEAEANAVFSALNVANLAAATEADKQFLNSVNQICNDAETKAFNPAISAAGGTSSTAGKALQIGKIKNKVLKLKATLLLLGVKQAQGEDVAADIAAETKKFNNNIQQDKAQAGKASTKLAFSASTKGGK